MKNIALGLIKRNCYFIKEETLKPEALRDIISHETRSSKSLKVLPTGSYVLVFLKFPQIRNSLWC